MKRLSIFKVLTIIFALLGGLVLQAKEILPETVADAILAPAQVDPGPPVIIDIPNADMPLIQVALLLDTSGSMQGLIEQAKVQLWSIVSELAKARKDGQAPEFYVALYEYGKDSIPAKEGYIRQILPFTNDLDKLSEQLFPLRTNGGQEYCGMVIKRAAEELLWVDSPSSLRLIFVAGNEPFTQGTVDFEASCASAAARDISINTIFCGNNKEGIDSKWQRGAEIGKGSYFNIDQNLAAVANINAPQDEEILKLNTSLNGTYLAYGQDGKMRQELQTSLDKGMKDAAGNAGAVARANGKATGLYRNDSWDLIDGYTQKTIKLEELKKEDLPEIMQTMTLEEQKAYIEKMAAERKIVQEQMIKLNVERAAFVEAELKKLGGEGEKTLQEATIEAIRVQANKCGFEM